MRRCEEYICRPEKPQVTPMSVFEHSEFDRHEAIHFFDDPATGLRAIIAVHSTVLGPAAGGCRRWHYASGADALTDVLRLSRGMTYKNAVAGLPFGGGKSVILAADNAPAPAEQFREFGRRVQSLGGAYITAEDVGIAMDDMRIVREETEYVSGLPQEGKNAGGDPSPWTAYGVFLGMRAALRNVFGSESFAGKRIAVQGVGHVGHELCRLLAQAGAELYVADVNRGNLRRLAKIVPVTEVAPTDILFADVDVLAPCALGNVLNSETIPRIRARVIAGAANNQLAREIDGERLAAREILYAPDYVMNAGGVISVAREYLGESSEDEVRAEVGRIPGRLDEIFAEAAKTGRPTNVIADELARRIVEESVSDQRRIA